MDNLIATTLAIREQVCAACFRRPSDCEDRPLAEPRECEQSCELFLHLPRLIGLVQWFGGEQPCGYEAAVRNLPCGTCGSTIRCADICPTPRPLDNYVPDVMALLERIKSRATTGAGGM